MKDCLIIMQPREIPVCIDAFRNLDISKAWFKGYTEAELEEPIGKFIETTNYENYIIASDDLVPQQSSLTMVRNMLEEHEAATGWSNMSTVNTRGNVRFKPIHGNYAFYVLTHSITQLYKVTEGLRLNSFPSSKQILAKNGEFYTYFSGFSFFGMRRKLWLKYPFQVYHGLLGFKKNGFGSDFMQSDRLNKAGIPILCDSRAFFYHLASKQNMIVGKVLPTVIHEA